MDLRGKKIDFLGDGITEGVGTTAPSRCFVSRISKETGAVVRNYGLRGTCIAAQQSCSHGTGKELCTRFSEMDGKADLIVVFAGTNDYGYGNAPLGTFADQTSETFCRALHVLFSGLRSRFPNAQLAAITPLPRKLPSCDPNRDLKAYCSAIVGIAAYYDVPCLALYGSFSSDAQLWNLYVACLPDGLHPDDHGHAILARRIGQFLEYL